MALIRWNPFHEMEAFSRRFNELFAMPAESTLGWKPTVDIHETPEHFEVHAELPGVKKEDVHLTIEGGVLMLTGERKTETETNEAKVHRVERSYGRFERSFALPDNVDPERVVAEFKDGVLTMKLAKRVVEQPKAKSITIA